MKYLTLLALCFGFIVNLSAQSDESFNQAKLHLANHKLNQAIPILEKLWASDKNNANLNYLLGLCYVKEDKEIERAVELLETASTLYATNYKPGSSRERRAPEYVYYYLTIAYSKNDQCEDALRALNKFYQVYTYQDEYYLVDGQKWVRECNMQLLPEEPEPELALAEEVEEPEPEVARLPGKQAEKPTPTLEPEPEVALQEAPEKTEPEPPVVKPEPVVKVEEPKIKERLVPFDDWDKLRTRNVDYTTLNSLYGIQVAALIDLKPTKDFMGLKNVEVYVDENGIFRYVIGRFSYRSQAESLKAKIQERGYTDAFIVDVNQPLYATEVLGVGAESINWGITGKVDFRVQVGAFRQIVPEWVAEKYLEVDGIKENHQNELTVLTVGSYGQYQDAADYRDALISKGIEDAFVVAFNYGNKIPLKEAKEHVARQSRLEADEPSEDAETRKKRARADF